MNNILSYDDFNIDLTLSEGLSTIDFISILMEAEMMEDMNDIDEGFTEFERIPGTRQYKNKTRFVPGKNDTDDTNTKIFKKDGKTFSYHKQLLEKSGVMSYNLYKFKDIWISKLLKHPERYKLGEFSKHNTIHEIDEDSIKKFLKRSALYIRSIIKEQNFDVDIITYPSSSSNFNEILTDAVMEGYKNIPSIKCIPNLFVKDIQTVEVNKTRAKELGMSDDEINKLEHKLIAWKTEYKDIYPLRVELDKLKDTLMMYMSGFNNKRGRRPNAYFACIQDIKKTIKEINNAKKTLKVGDAKTKTKDNKMDDVNLDSFNKGEQKELGYKSRGFEIKSMDDTTRRAIENLFTINKGLDNKGGKSIEEKLKGKNVVIFDDNISSGATLDDMCLTLQKCGVKSILAITMAIIPPTTYGDYSTQADWKNRDKE